MTKKIESNKEQERNNHSAGQALLYRTSGNDGNPMSQAFVLDYNIWLMNPKPYLSSRYFQSLWGTSFFNVNCSNTLALKGSDETPTYPSDESLYSTKNHK